MFWRSLGPNTEAPMYGADTLGTLFAADDDDAWNVGRLVSPRPLPPAVFFYPVISRRNKETAVDACRSCLILCNVCPAVNSAWVVFRSVS